MNTEVNVLQHLSRELEERVAASGNLVVAIRNAARQHISGIAWQSNVVVTSEQAFGTREEYEVVSASGRVVKARIAGRDAGTNLLVLRLDESVDALEVTPSTACVGGLVISLGAGIEGETTARLGSVQSVGAQWYSRAGGRVDQRIGLDIRLRRTEEGGPILDAAGGLIGMATLGRPGEVLAIPAATVARIVPLLLEKGCVPRGWLGLALQPIAVPDALVTEAGQPVGTMVMSTIDGGPAAQAGIKAGDIVLTVNGAPVRGRRRLAAQLGEESVGQAAQLRLIRGGEIMTLEVLVSTRP